MTSTIFSIDNMHSFQISRRYVCLHLWIVFTFVNLFNFLWIDLCNDFLWIYFKDGYLLLPTVGPVWNTSYVLSTYVKIERKNVSWRTYEKLIWLASRATVVQDWEKAMHNIKAINKDVWKDMMQQPPMWTRSTLQ